MCIDGIYYSPDIWELAEFMHVNYLEIAEKAGWKVQEKTDTSFKELPEQNQKVMLELAWRVIKKEHEVD